jgi:hypothetical protein
MVTLLVGVQDGKNPWWGQESLLSFYQRGNSRINPAILKLIAPQGILHALPKYISPFHRYKNM